MPEIATTPAGHALVFAVDYDRTITDGDGRPSPGALQAIRQLRGLGIRVYLMTGRCKAELAAYPEIAEAFDGFCLEGGAQWGSWSNPIGPNNANIALAAAARLESAGVAIVRRVASFSCNRADLDVVRREAADCGIFPNHDRVDVLPPGLSKAIGIDAVLGMAAIRDAHVVALGDGENDVPLLEGADVGLATADAVPELKAVADEVLAVAGPEAVVEVARRLLQGDWQAVPAPPTPSPPAAEPDNKGSP